MGVLECAGGGGVAAAAFLGMAALLFWGSVFGSYDFAVDA